MLSIYKIYEHVLLESHNNEYIAYHGSDIEIDKFTNKFVSNDNVNASGPGIYFTNSIQDAMQWGKYIHKVILRPRNIVTNEVPAEKVNRKALMTLLNNVEDYSLNWAEDLESDKKIAIQSAIKYSDTEDEVFDNLRNEQFNYNLQGFMNAMSKIGYDMLKLKKDFTELRDVKIPYHYIVYNPSIITIIDINKVKIE